MIDSHTHAWGPSTSDHPWSNDVLEERVEELPVEDVYDSGELSADMNDAEIEKAVVVGYPLPGYRDNWFTLKAAEENDRLAGIVTIDAFADTAAEQLREYMANDGILGFRLGTLFPPDQMWEKPDPSTTWLLNAIEETNFWEAARETDAIVQILANTDQINQIEVLASTYPDLRIVLDHLARADVSQPPEKSGLRDLAANRNIIVKISAIPYLSEEDYPYPDVHEYVRKLLDWFGRERLMWGSDYPNVSDVADYKECYTWLSHVSELSDKDRRWLVQRTFERHFQYF